MNASDREEKEFREKVLIRAATDHAFRQELLTDPKGALTRALGESAANRRVMFVENPNVDTVVLLPEYVGEQAALTEEELEAAAGGCTATCCTLSCGWTGVRLN